MNRESKFCLKKKEEKSTPHRERISSWEARTGA